MINEKIELPSNYNVKTINDLSKYENIVSLNIEDETAKLELNLFNLDQLELFNKMKIINNDSMHVTIICTRQTYIMLNLSEIMKKSIMKSVKIKGSRIYIDIFTSEFISKSIFINNLKILERLELMSNDVSVNSKIHEVLYHANKILRANKIQVDKEMKIRKILGN